MTAPLRESTTVAIVGGGVSGLTGAALLRACGIDSIVPERQTRAHVEQRQRAGLVEHRAVRMFEQWGLGDVLHGFPASNFLEIRVDGRSRLLAEDLPGLETAGKTVPQQVLVRGLIAAFLADGTRGVISLAAIFTVPLTTSDSSRSLGGTCCCSARSWLWW